MKKVLSLVQVLDNLSRMPRIGGVMFAGIDPDRSDSIAEHSYKTAYLTLLFATIAKENGLVINFEKLLTAALTHDWNESILLDIPSGSPSYRSYFNIVNLREAVKEAEQNANQAIEDFLADDVHLEITNLGLSTDELMLLNAADLAALLIEILEWKYRGMKYEWFDYLWANTIHRFSESTSKYTFMTSFINEIEAAYKRGIKPANPFLTQTQFQHLKKSE